ncbi:phage tail protein [Streptomyces xiamenensis]|uniref:phage tail protein n=1 Tax=Streptomyces xiamenensis TaxID=408015 RepID=UPI003412C568
MARTESGKQPLPEQQHTRTPAATSAPLPAAALHQLQRSAGNAAVARLVAQRYTPPMKPSPAQAPGLRRVNADIGAKRQKLSAHPAPTAESRAAQDAAVAPPDDKQAQAKTRQAEKMNAAEPGDFDKAAFITAVNQAVEAQAPKNLDEADNFSDSGNADRIKDEVDGQVTDGAESSAEDIATTTGEAPDTSTATDKEVTPLSADQPPGNPGAPNASDAVPARQPEEVTDFSEGQRDTEQQMADADVTEEQLARGNEPDFDNALSEKKQGEEETAAAPGQARAAENAEIQTAKSGAAAAGAQAMAGLTATRQETGAQVDSGKNETKSADEKKREQVTAKLQKVFDDTKTDVEKTLDGLDDKVDTQFTNGEKRARDAFTADHERRMKAYKDKRYSGLRGKARWVKDKFAGLPDEANDLYQESRKLYVNRMQGVISDIADTIGRELGRAKSRIERGRTELQAEVEKLPADLRRFGEEAAADFSGQFDDLETTVDEKSEQLVQDLAQKYTEALDAIDEEIKALQEANKGLWDRIKDAVVGVIQTIIELTNALMGILAKAASAVSKIIKDPIGFLGNVVRFVGDGLNLFTANIEQHLKTGLVSWLLGTAVKTGLEIPAKFDAKGIVQLLASLLGLTWDTIRTKIVRKGVPDKAMATVEKTIPEAQALQREGPAGLTKEITGESGDLKKTILDDLKSYLIPTVIVSGIAWIVSLLTPASAFVRAVKGIIDIVTFIVTQAAQITDFMNAILDAVIAIADGAAAGVPKLIEAALSTSIPVLLGFLAALLGIGSLANKVRSVFQKVSRPVGRAIDKIIDRIARAGRKLWGRRRNPERGSERTDGARKDSSSVVDDVVRDLKAGLGANPSAEKAATVADSIYSRHKSRGLKYLEFSPKEQRPGEFDVLVRASPLRRVLIFRVSDLQLRFPRTACIAHMTDTKGVTENLGKFLVRRKRPGQTGEGGEHHAEQVMIKILWSGYFVGDRTKGVYHLQMSLTRRPCQKCGPALEGFKHELADGGYHLDITARIVSSYSAEGDDIAINVLSSLRKKNFKLELLTLEQIVAEGLLSGPEEKLPDEDRENLSAEASKVQEYLDKASVKKGG